jgi:hypothetical protein
MDHIENEKKKWGDNQQGDFISFVTKIMEGSTGRWTYTDGYRDSKGDLISLSLFSFKISKAD